MHKKNHIPDSYLPPGTHALRLASAGESHWITAPLGKSSGILPNPILTRLPLTQLGSKVLEFSWLDFPLLGDLDFEFSWLSVA